MKGRTVDILAVLSFFCLVISENPSGLFCLYDDWNFSKIRICIRAYCRKRVNE